MTPDNPSYDDVFSIPGGRMFYVRKVVEHLERIKHPVGRVNVRRLVWKFFPGVLFDLSVGSRGWIERTDKADMECPILVLDVRKTEVYRHFPLDVGDGHHRLWKAWKTGKRQINSYVVEWNELCKRFPPTFAERYALEIVAKVVGKPL